MQLRLGPTLALGAALLAGSPALANTVVPLDPHHTSASFSVAHLTITKVTGQIPLIKSEMTVGNDNLPVAASATLDAAKIETQDAKRDQDLRGDKWFDVAKYPTIVFRSTSVAPGPKNSFTMHGTLTMHGVTKPVVLSGNYEGSAKDPMGKTHLGYSASGVVDRTEYGVGNAPAAIVGNNINITLQVEALKP